MIVPTAKTLLLQSDPWNGTSPMQPKTVAVELAKTKYSALVILTPEGEDPITISLLELEETLEGLKKVLDGFYK